MCVCVCVDVERFEASASLFAFGCFCFPSLALRWWWWWWGREQSDKQNKERDGMVDIKQARVKATNKLLINNTHFVSSLVCGGWFSRFARFLPTPVRWYRFQGVRSGYLFVSLLSVLGYWYLTAVTAINKIDSIQPLHRQLLSVDLLRRESFSFFFFFLSFIACCLLLAAVWGTGSVAFFFVRYVLGVVPPPLVQERRFSTPLTMNL